MNHWFFAKAVTKTSLFLGKSHRLVYYNQSPYRFRMKDTPFDGFPYQGKRESARTRQKDESRICQTRDQIRSRCRHLLTLRWSKHKHTQTLTHTDTHTNTNTYTQTHKSACTHRHVCQNHNMIITLAYINKYHWPLARPTEGHSRST